MATTYRGEIQTLAYNGRNWPGVRLVVWDDTSGTVAGQGSLQWLNRRVAWSYGTHVAPDYRNRALARFLERCKLAVTRDAGRSIMVASVRHDNGAQRATMRHARPRWRATASDDTVTLYTRRLTPRAPRDAMARTERMIQRLTADGRRVSRALARTTPASIDAARAGVLLAGYAEAIAVLRGATVRAERIA